MGRSALKAAFCAAALAGAAAALSGSCSKEPPAQGTQPDGGQVCQSGGHECGAGTRCANRICTATCTGGASCGAGNYCPGAAPEDVCAPIAPKTCKADLDCPVPQQCLFGRCVSSELLADGGFQFCNLGAVDDHCAPDAVCYPIGFGPSCFGLSPCGQDGSCPGTAISNVCNHLPDGGTLIAGKERVCIFLYCSTNADCGKDPANGAQSVCFRGVAHSTYGACQFGSVGDPCFSDADCPRSNGCRGQDGGVDDGGTPGACACIPDAGLPDAGGC